MRSSMALVAISCILLAGPLRAAAETDSPAAAPAVSLLQAVASPERTPAFAARDVYRHPVEVLRFFGVEPDHHVVELWPGGGWWTEILAPYLRAAGQYTAAGFVPSDDPTAYRDRIQQRFQQQLDGAPERYDRVVVTQLGLPDQWQIAAPGSADVVLTFRNVHNWLKGRYEREVFAAAFRALKPGGVLGVVEHRGDPDMSDADIDQSGYVPEARVIQLAEDAGFRLVARSEINANPRDLKRYAEGVWTLPPSLRLGELDREHYLAIGESDRMTLKFVKREIPTRATAAP
ncbi:methyltransferase [Flagellatimonas centrodinii]|uniref:class I SAM-dependent methyltransferase n=1 Tax=Flagellatimonas centrodinii TaxID=2806210 RepID=UPI001FEF9837|nr:methyltransferase [Flagellatimonas centrodinii]ULQ47994.1 methyltransferase [Flagellatimonas centrodinii]